MPGGLREQPVAPILRLRRDLHALGPFNLSLPHSDDFVPHVTITEALSGPAVDDALVETISRQAPGGTFVCGRVTRIVPDDRFHFRRAREFRFGGTGNADEQRGAPR